MAHTLDRAGKSAYVKILRDTGEPALARNAIGFSQPTIRRHMDLDPQWAMEVDEAREAYAAKLAQSVAEWALQGVEVEETTIIDPVGNKTVRKVRRRSEKLLLEHIRRFMAEYRPQAKIETEVSGTVAHVTLDDLRQLTAESRTHLDAILAAENRLQ